MRAKEVSDAGAFSLDLSGVLTSGESLASVTGSVIPAGPALFAVAVSGSSVTWSLSGGTAGRYYLCSLVITTSTRTLRRSVYVAVVADGSLQEYPTVLQLLNDARVALRDDARDTGAVTTGLMYRWEDRDESLIWSNDRLIYAYNETIREMCRRRPIHDKNTPAVCQFTTVSGEQGYPLDPRVLVPIRAYRNGSMLTRCQTVQMDSRLSNWREHTTQAQPTHWVISPEVVTGGDVELYPVPGDTYTIGLHVDRYPLEREAWETRNTYAIDLPHVDREAVVDGIRMILLADSELDSDATEAAADAEAAFSLKVGPRLNHRQLAARRAFGGQQWLTASSIGV